MDGAVLRIDYLAVPGLPALSFEVAAQECLAIEGPSGSGKTRLLRAIADLDPSEGYMFLEGIERRELTGPPGAAACAMRPPSLPGGRRPPAATSAPTPGSIG